MAVHYMSTGIDFQDFSHVSGATSELLDDYEEGVYSWTCISDGSGGWSTRSGYDTLHYSKIGTQCNVGGRFETTTGGNYSGGTLARISLPFTVANYGDFAGHALMSIAHWSWGTTATVVFGYAIHSTSYADTYKIDDDDTMSAIHPDMYFEGVMTCTFNCA